jgi:hypothetical protein
VVNYQNILYIMACCFRLSYDLRSGCGRGIGYDE